MSWMLDTCWGLGVLVLIWLSTLLRQLSRMTRLRVWVSRVDGHEAETGHVVLAFVWRVRMERDGILSYGTGAVVTLKYGHGKWLIVLSTSLNGWATRWECAWLKGQQKNGTSD